MAWNGNVPTQANWSGNPQFAGDETLYTTPKPATTTTNPNIGIVDGNEIPLPTAYNTFDVATLGATQLNSTNITNTQNISTDNIDTNTINGNPVPVDASQWSLYPAIHEVAMATYSLTNASSVSANASLVAGTLTQGGAVNVGTDNLNPASAPSLTIGNSTIGRCSTTIYGANNLTGYGALNVTGGVTLDAGSITANSGTSIHGINMYAAQVVDGSPSTVRMTLGETGVSIYTAQPEVQGISLNALASAITLNTGTELTTRSVLGTEIEAGTGLYVSGLTAGSYNDGRMFIQHICPAYAETTNLIIDGANDLTSGKTGVELYDGVVVSTDILQVREIDNRDTTGVNINSNSSGITLTTTDAGDPPYDITLNSVADVVLNSGVKTTINSVGDVSIKSTSGALTLTTRPDPYSSAGDVNVVSNKSFQCFAGNTNGGGSAYDGELKYLCGSNILFASYNGGDITFDNTTNGNGNIPISRRQIFTAGADISFTAGTGSNVNMNSIVDMNGNDIININGAYAQGLYCDNLYNNTASSIVVHSVLDLNGNNIIANTITTTTNGNLTLSPNGTGGIIASKGLSMSNNNIINANTITGQSTLTLASGGTNTNVVLTPNGTGLIVANKGLNMNSNDITNAVNIGGIGALTLTSGGTNTNIVLTPTGTGKILCSKSVDLNGQTLTNAQLITTPSNTDLTLTPSGTGLIKAGKGLNMNSLPITNLSTLNGHNIYSYGNFYYSTTQTLTATGTATRVKMDTTATSSGITLDTTTNIGRLTFTNAGTYEVKWNGYFLHGTGGASNNFIWIRLNGTDVAGTGKKQRLDAGLNDVSIGSSAQIVATAGQYIEFFWAADDTNTPLTAVASSSPYPATPSFSCSINIVA